MSNSDQKKDVKYKRIPKTLTVKSTSQLTPNMRRVTLYGDALNDFPTNSEGAVIKMFFEQPGLDKAPMRTYTLSEQRIAPNEIDIDFMLHSHNNVSQDASVDLSIKCSSHGVAVPWSLNAKAGDEISFFGPGPVRFINLEADCFMLAADMTALPALKANLKLLPENARGKVFIEILSEADKQDLQMPANIELTWVINETPGSDASPLFHAIEQAKWQIGKVTVWAACEFKTMKKIRNYLKTGRGIEKSHLYISSYWKKGNTEEQHKAARKADKEESQNKI